MSDNKRGVKRTSFVCWAGFAEGLLFIDSIDDHWGGQNERHAPALFVTKRQARQQFEDVRKVEIRVVEPRRNS